VAEPARRSDSALYKIGAQTRKACHIADVLLARGIDPAAIDTFTQWQREQVEAKAGVSGSSQEVWTMVRSICEHARRRHTEPVPLDVQAL
jgi:hypothetical protein